MCQAVEEGHTTESQEQHTNLWVNFLEGANLRERLGHPAPNKIDTEVVVPNGGAGDLKATCGIRIVEFLFFACTLGSNTEQDSRVKISALWAKRVLTLQTNE